MINTNPFNGIYEARNVTIDVSKDGDDALRPKMYDDIMKKEKIFF